jgi:hypothetical protein
MTEADLFRQYAQEADWIRWPARNDRRTLVRFSPHPLQLYAACAQAGHPFRRC